MIMSNGSSSRALMTDTERWSPGTGLKGIDLWTSMFESMALSVVPR